MRHYRKRNLVSWSWNLLTVFNLLNVDSIWYQRNKVVLWPLIPLTTLYIGLIKLRRKFYQMGICKVHKFPVPIIVVGNLTVGGTGKTPLVMHIINRLRQQGWQPGVVSAGYKGQHQTPTTVHSYSQPHEVGDEAVLLAKRLNCPIVVGHNRAIAVQKLLTEHKINIIVSDDGLQHYALNRDIEIAVIDGDRQFGNGYCLPAGPLREPKSRLLEVDLVVSNSRSVSEDVKIDYTMEYQADNLYNAVELDAQMPLDSLRGKKVHAVAGIGNPKRFFQLLEAYGLQVIAHPYPDHHPFIARDIGFSDDLPVIMTEKDWVKCISFVSKHHWVLPVTAQLSAAFDAQLLTFIQDRYHG